MGQLDRLKAALSLTSSFGLTRVESRRSVLQGTLGFDCYLTDSMGLKGLKALFVQPVLTQHMKDLSRLQSQDFLIRHSH